MGHFICYFCAFRFEVVKRSMRHVLWFWNTSLYFVSHVAHLPINIAVDFHLYWVKGVCFGWLCDQIRHWLVLLCFRSFIVAKLMGCWETNEWFRHLVAFGLIFVMFYLSSRCLRKRPYITSLLKIGCWFLSSFAVVFLVESKLILVALW